MPVYVPPSATGPYKSQGGMHVRQFMNDSVGSTSFVTAPAAGATVTWLFVPISATYSVQLLYGYGALPAPGGAPNNIRLQVGNVTVTSLTMLNAASTLQALTVILTVTNDQSIGLNAINTDAGQMVGSIIATQVG